MLLLARSASSNSPLVLLIPIQKEEEGHNITAQLEVKAQVGFLHGLHKHHGERPWQCPVKVNMLAPHSLIPSLQEVWDACLQSDNGGNLDS